MVSRREMLAASALAPVLATGSVAAAASSLKPRTFVLVHGSWHGGWAWKELAALLEKDGHRVYRPSLTGLGERKHLLSRDINLSTHVNDVLELIAAEELEQVILVGHSYAGLVITGVADKLRQKPAQLVYLDAFVPHSGQSGFDLMNAKYSDSWRKKAAEHGEGFKVPIVLDAKAMGVIDPAKARWLDAKLTPMPINTFEEKLVFDEAKWNTLPRAYVRCGQYAGFKPTAERVEKEKWPVRTLDCGHDAMVAAPEALANVLNEFAGLIS